MKSLNKKQSTELAEHVKKLADADATLGEAVDQFNLDVEFAKGKLENVLEEYNDAVESANEFRSGLADSMETYQDERSEKWHEGDAGQAYASWFDSWANEFPDAEIEFPEPVEKPDTEALDQIQELSESPE